VKTGKVVREFEYGATRNVGSKVSTLAHNVLAKKDRQTIGFYAHVKLYPGLQWEKQQTEGKFKEETSEVLHLGHSFILCWKLDNSEFRPEIHGEF